MLEFETAAENIVFFIVCVVVTVVDLVVFFIEHHVVVMVVVVSQSCFLSNLSDFTLSSTSLVGIVVVIVASQSGSCSFPKM